MLIKTLQASFVACLLTVSSCRTIPDAHRIVFELEGSLDCPVLYLETEDKGVVTIKLTPTDEVSKEAAYKLVSFSRPGGSLLTDEKGKPVALGAPLISGENTFYYRPATAGVHTLEPVVADTYGDSEQRCQLSVTVTEEREVPFSAQLQVQGVQRAAAGTGKVSLAITIQATDRALQQAQWQITSRQLTGGLEGTLEEDRSLKHGRNLLQLLLTPATLTGPPLLKVLVTGPGGKALPVEVNLSSACRELLGQQLKQLPHEMTAVARNVKEALQGTPAEEALKSSYRTQKGLQQYLEAILHHIKSNLAVLGDVTMNAALQRLEGGAQKEMNDALAGLAQAISHFSRFTRGINETDNCGDLPLHDAVSWRDLSLVRFLLPRTHYINVENKQGQTPLDKAKPYSDIYRLLKSQGASPGIDGRVRAHFGRGVNDYNRKGYTPLIEAVREKEEDGVRLLLKHPKLEIDKGKLTERGNEGITALMFASGKYNNLKLVKLLLKHGAEINANHYIIYPVVVIVDSKRKYLHHWRSNHNALWYARHWKDNTERRGGNYKPYKEIEDYLREQGAFSSTDRKHYDKAYYRSGKWKTANWYDHKEGRNIVTDSGPYILDY